MFLNYFFKRRLSVKFLIGQAWLNFSKKFVSGRSDWECRGSIIPNSNKIVRNGRGLVTGQLRPTPQADFTSTFTKTIYINRNDFL
jgi:hypothetical protein